MKRLYKSRENRMLFGVCGGLAEYLDVDPSIVRIIWVLISLPGVGLLAYIAAGLILPFKDEL